MNNAWWLLSVPARLLRALHIAIIKLFAVTI